jgi:protocatechuate 3,4-dioxygenase beta subunit
MSTKTTFKRVALVAVAALGLGVVTSVAPASAGVTLVPTAVTVGTIPTLAPGVTSKIPVTITAPFSANTDDTFTITAKITSAPSGSAFASLASVGKTADGSAAGSSFISGVVASGNTIAGKMTWSVSSTSTAVFNGGGGTPTVNTDLTATVSTVLTSTNATATKTSGTVNIDFTPDKAGSYTFLVSTGSGAVATASYSAGNASTTFIATTGNVATTVAITAAGAAPKANSTYGTLYKVTIKDSAGAVAALGLNESITIAPNQTTTTITGVKASDATTIGTAVTGTAGLTLTSANFISGVAYILVKDSTATATTIVLTATGSGLLSSAVTTTFSITTVVAAAGTSLALSDGTATRPGSGHVAYASNADTAATTATSHSYTITDTAACTAAATVKIATSVLDTSGKVTGVTGATVDNGVVTLTCNAGLTAYVGTVTVTATLSTAGQNFTLYVGDSNSTSGKYNLVTSEASAATKATVTASPANVIRTATGGSVALTAKVTDQFGAALANAAVAVSVAGRNVTTTSAALASDASGNVSYALADKSTSTTALTDVVTFALTSTTGQVAGKNVVTINYGAVTAGTITITTTDTTASVANATVAPQPIFAGDGVENGAVALSATVKDANGALLSYIPVTWTVTGTGVAIPSTGVTSYTSAAGVATSSVYGWIAGTYTVTATAGGKSTTGTVTFASTTAGNARVLSATVDGNVVTAKVVDRFGNPVKGATVYATKSGQGYFGNGLSRTSDTTDAAGTAQFGIAGGNASVTVSTLDPTAVAGTNAAGQTCALAGNQDCASGATAATAFTAATAGTLLVAETYVGGTFAPAGVSRVVVEVTDAASANASAATDAAAEATDAANAATDAANAAAEAADAATAAAQDAADAVAALSTQVSEMVNALKKQITALTNLVIKIQKKVKA